MGWTTRRVISEGLRTHPAVQAWASATSIRTVPECVHVLCEHPWKSLYWLPASAPGGKGVFAKRSRASTMLIERTIYEEILPQLRITAPRCYGSLLTEPYGWLFVEDVGRHRYSQSEPGHLALAALWLGTLHVTAAQVPAARSLPDGGPARYRTHLRSAVERITLSLDTWQYPRDEWQGLQWVLSQCAALEARWARIEEGCEGLPATVVHGDFQSKNVCLRMDSGSLDLFPIDWEMVGRGNPAVDLAGLWLPRVDLETYWRVVREAWPAMDHKAVMHLAAVGRFLNGCAALDWKSATLRSEKPRARNSAARKLRAMAELQAEAARAAGVLE